MTATRRLALALTLGAVVTVVGCARPTGQPLGPKPSWPVRYWRHRCADFWDVFTFTFAAAPPVKSSGGLNGYGFDTGVDFLGFGPGLGYMQFEEGLQWAAEGRAAYAAAPYGERTWRFLWFMGMDKVVEPAAGIAAGNPYAAPAAYADSPYQPYYANWAETLTTPTGAYKSRCLTGGQDVPYMRLVHNSEADGGPYKGCEDGWGRHILRPHIAVALPEPFFFKFATRIGLKFNWCQAPDFVLGLLCIDQYGDDLFVEPEERHPYRFGP